MWQSRLFIFGVWRNGGISYGSNLSVNHNEAEIWAAGVGGFGSKPISTNDRMWRTIWQPLC